MCSGLWEETDSWNSPPHLSGNKTYVRNTGWLRKSHFLQDQAAGQPVFLVIVVDADNADARQDEKCSFHSRNQTGLCYSSFTERIE